MVLVGPYACQPKWVIMDDKAWHPPRVDWIKMNMDGLINLNNEEAVVGGGVHNSHGDWIIDFAKNIGVAYVFQPKDRAIMECFEGLDISEKSPDLLIDCLFKDHSDIVVLDSILTHDVV
ncbi:hypothetical protein Goari_017075 [Gossypium aridum]|uniref:Uncharacterized protein n=1 Tax=Gossypium aridum TaxID=34290 RepID=A0A7J8WKN0_GOSAI|nr:hypothetical protein [Gossypium aridum]